MSTKCIFTLWFIVASGFPAGPLHAQDSDPNAVTRQTFRVGGDVLKSIGEIGENISPAQASASISAEPKPLDGADHPPVQSIQQILSAELGIPFPEGTWVRHDPRTGRLEIQHQPAVIAAIQAYLEALNSGGPKQINIRLEIYQVPALAALRAQQLSGPLGDHRPILESIEKMLERGEASLVTALSVVARSGQRALTSNKYEVIYPTEVDWHEDDKIVLPAAFETREAGTILETDPVLGPDDYTIDLNVSVEHHTAPPIMKPTKTTSPVSGVVNIVDFPEFHAKRVVTQITFGDGGVKLLAAWRPTGKREFESANVMQLAFLTAEIQSVRAVVPVNPSPRQ